MRVTVDAERAIAFMPQERRQGGRKSADLSLIPTFNIRKRISSISTTSSTAEVYISLGLTPLVGVVFSSMSALPGCSACHLGWSVNPHFGSPTHP